ncbi:hypothetical protein Btru_050588, partial [Bulinus truncatus]
MSHSNDDDDDDDNDDESNNTINTDHGTGKQTTAAPDLTSRLIQILRQDKVGQGSSLKPEKEARGDNSLLRLKRFWPAFPFKQGHVTGLKPEQSIADKNHATGGKKGAMKAKLIKRLNPKGNNQEDEEFKLECKTELAKRLKDENFGIHANDCKIMLASLEKPISKQSDLKQPVSKQPVSKQPDSIYAERLEANNKIEQTSKVYGLFTGDSQDHSESIQRAKARMRLDLVSFIDGSTVLNSKCSSLRESSLNVERMSSISYLLRRSLRKNRISTPANDISNVQGDIARKVTEVKSMDTVLTDVGGSQPQITLACPRLSPLMSHESFDIKDESNKSTLTEYRFKPPLNSSLLTAEDENGCVNQPDKTVSRPGDDLRNNGGVLGQSPVDLGESLRHATFCRNRFVETQIAKLKKQREPDKRSTQSMHLEKLHGSPPEHMGVSNWIPDISTCALKENYCKGQANRAVSGRINEMTSCEMALFDSKCKSSPCSEQGNEIISCNKCLQSGETKSLTSKECLESGNGNREPSLTQEKHWNCLPRAAGSSHTDLWDTPGMIASSYASLGQAIAPQLSWDQDDTVNTLRPTREVMTKADCPVPTLRSTQLPFSSPPPPGRRSDQLNEMVTNGCNELQREGDTESMSTPLRLFRTHPSVLLRYSSAEHTSMRQSDTYCMSNRNRKTTTSGVHFDGIHLDGSHLDGNHLDSSRLDGNHLDGRQSIDDINLIERNVSTENKFIVACHSGLDGEENTDHKDAPPSDAHAYCTNTLTAYRPTAAHYVKWGPKRKDPPLPHNPPLTLHDTTAAVKPIDRDGQLSLSANKQKRGSRCDFAPGNTSRCPAPPATARVDETNRPTAGGIVGRRYTTASTAMAISPAARHDREDESGVSASGLSIERDVLNNNDGGGDIAPSPFPCHVATRHSYVVPAHTTTTIVSPSFNTIPYSARFRVPPTDFRLDERNYNNDQDENNPREPAHLNRLSSANWSGICVVRNRFCEHGEGLVQTSVIDEKKREGETWTTFADTTRTSSPTGNLSSCSSLEGSPSTRDLKSTEGRHAESNQASTPGLVSWSATCADRVARSDNLGTSRCNSGGFAGWDDDNETKPFSNLHRLTASRSAGNASSAVGLVVSKGRCTWRDVKPTVGARDSDLSSAGAWRRTAYTDIYRRGTSPLEREYLCEPRAILGSGSTAAVISNGQSGKVPRARDCQLLAEYVDGRCNVNSFDVTPTEGHLCSLETLTYSLPTRAKDKKGLNVRSIIRKSTQTSFPDSISGDDRKEKAALISHSSARCYKVHAVKDAAGHVSGGKPVTRVSFSVTTRTDDRDNESGHARELTCGRRLISSSAPLSSSPTRTTVHIERRPSLTKSDYGPESEPLLVETGMDGRGIEIIVSDENDARVSTVNSGKRAVLRRIWMILLDNRVAGRPDSERALRPHHEEYRVLKRVLNITFITIGVALLVSVFVVIIYTYV